MSFGWPNRKPAFAALNIRVKIKLFSNELILLMATLGISAFAAFRYGLVPLKEAPHVSFAWPDLVFSFLFLAVLIAFLRYKKFSRHSFRFFLLVMIFFGTQAFFGSFIQTPYNSALAGAVVAFYIFVRRVLAHDIAVAFALGGVASVFGLSLAPKAVAVMLLLFSFYDIIAVYKTKHMVQLARGMIEGGAIFGFIIPEHFKDFWFSKHLARPGEQFTILGSGDVGLPAIMIGSLAALSLPAALVTGIFTCAGAFITHILFINQKERRPMAALPPIATMTIIGYLVTFFI